ncbi:MAG: hypothetical protein E7561_04845 [Ruminococcaceae bacterium]|nr:hypothetical protein [Oscillospiraceae bacterium]
MSIVHKEEIVCPSCGYKENINVWQSLNTEMNPTEKKSLLEGTLLNFTCPKCGTSNNLCYPLLYHEMNDGIMIYLSPTPNDIEEAKKTFALQKNFLKNDEKYTYRIVRSANVLREKAIIFENGLDDRVVEVLKLVYVQQAENQYSDLKVEDVLMYKSDDKFYLQVIGNRDLSTEVELSNYNDIKVLMEDLLLNNDDFIVDRNWALNVLKKINTTKSDFENSKQQCQVDMTKDDFYGIKCNVCGMLLPSDSEFCQYCGCKLEHKLSILHDEAIKIRTTQPSVISKIFFIMFVAFGIVSFSLALFLIVENIKAIIPIVLFFAIISIVNGSLFFYVDFFLPKKYASITYKEKCYKKVARMKKYLRDGIITEEEFEKNKNQILKKIK